MLAIRHRHGIRRRDHGDRTEAPSSPRRRTGVVIGILVLVAAVVVGAVMIFNALRQNADVAIGATAGPTPSASTVPSATPVAQVPGAEVVTPSPSPSDSATPRETAPVPPPTTPEQRVVDTISNYYALLPDDLDGAWPTMTADYQENHAGGRSGYEAFWSAISDVTVADVTASAPDRGQATLTYYFRDGRVVQEVTSYRLVDEGGALKIAETEVLSSAQQ